MSKGLGKWERVLLAAVERDGYAYPAALADTVVGTLAARQAALRAAKTLNTKNLVDYWRFLRFAGPKVMICPPGSDQGSLGRPPVPDYHSFKSMTAA